MTVLQNIKSLVKDTTRGLFNFIGADIIRLPHSASLMQWLKEININKVVDIGANRGQFTLRILKTLPKAKFFCFEPLPDEYEILKKKFSKYPSFSILNYALGNKSGKTYFNKSRFSPSSSVLDMSELHKENFPFTDSTSKLEVIMERLDNFLPSINPDENTLIKIDVQGYESEIIAGGEELIKKSKVLIVEISFRELYKHQKLFDDLYPRLRDLGYSYKGSFNNVYSNMNGEILQADSIFIKE